MTRISISELEEIVARSLQNAGANVPMAESTARALVLAEAQGLASHGLSRVSQYNAHLRHGRVDGSATCQTIKNKLAYAIIDAKTGLAFPACELAIKEAALKAEEFGISIVGVINSHHAGVMVDHLRPLAELGLVGLAFSNVPAVMPVPNGRHPILGTNPIAALFPRRSQTPLMIDMSLSEVSRGKINIAAKNNESIPFGWALDSEGNPTTDAEAALDGSLLAIGASSSPKGSLLALLVELLASAVIGAKFGFKASSFFKDEGNIPKIGQTFIVINPKVLAGEDHYYNNFELLIDEMLTDDGVRIPGERRESLLREASRTGIEVSEVMISSLLQEKN